MSKPRILVVEDEAIVARDLQQVLLELGYQPVGLTPRAEEAITLVDELRPDLILMDIQLAGPMDGITAAQTIRTKFALPVVFITAFAAENILARAKLTEPFGYILKPYSERELHTVIEMALYKHQTEMGLRESMMHTQAILDNMIDSVITISEQGLMESFNKAASAMFGYMPEEAIGRNVSMLMPEPHRTHHDSYLEHYKNTGQIRIIGTPRELTGRRKDGSNFPMILSVSKVSRSEKITFVGLIRDITRSRESEQEIRRLAFFDSLTGLPNRRLLTDRLKHAMQTSIRTGRYMALMFLDMDHFKQLNDTLGHDIGDELLQQVAARLQSRVRDGDSVARLGGDEFEVLLEALGTDSHEAATQAEAIANKLLEALRQPYYLRQHSHICTPSIGIVVFMGDRTTVDELYKMADIAMYQAKYSGRNAIKFFDPEMQTAAENRAKLESDMRLGLANNEFMLHYQIQVNQNGAPTGVEALLRWHSAERGMVMPGDFIGLAEESGIILPLGQRVLETACAQLVEWARRPETSQWTIAVNVSAVQFAQPEFVASIISVLQKSGARAELLKLELTESMLVDDVADTISKMHKIQAVGVSFSLDDFGTGYSSLSILRSLPLNQLKIDQSFVRNLLTDHSNAVIARTIVALGHNLGLKVIAEGVETAEQFAYLAGIGCNAFQGYYFGRPVSANTLEGIADTLKSMVGIWPIALLNGAKI